MGLFPQKMCIFYLSHMEYKGDESDEINEKKIADFHFFRTFYK
jgi:hypothetical protein